MIQDCVQISEACVQTFFKYRQLKLQEKPFFEIRQLESVVAKHLDL